MTYNIRSGRSSDLQNIAEVINQDKPDLVGLEEVDFEAVRTGNVNQSYRLGQLTGMASLYRAAFSFPDGGSYGLALLSRFPILTSDKLDLTSSAEQRIMITVTVKLDTGAQITVAITHLDLDAATRQTQAYEIVAALQSDPSAILMGDFNEGPTGMAVGILAAALIDVWPVAGTGNGYTFTATAPTERLDFIMLGSAWTLPFEAYVPVTTASDHRPVVTTLQR